jgi:hypothetical protein
MKETKVVINKVEFNIRKFGVIDSNTKMAQLISFFGPIFGSVIGDTLSEMLIGHKSKEEIDKSAQSLFTDKWDKLERINPRSLLSLKDVLIDNRYISVKLKDGSVVDFSDEVLEDVFCDYPQGLIELMIDVGKFNFSDFFTKIIGELLPMIK